MRNGKSVRRKSEGVVALAFLAIVTASMAVGRAQAASTAQASASPLAKRVHIGQIVFAEDVQSGKPIRPGKTFKAGLSRIYAFFTFSGLRASDTIGDNWYRNDVRAYWDSNGVGQVLGNISEANSGSLRLWWEPDEKYTAGQYRFQLLVNGEILQQATFTVR